MRLRSRHRSASRDRSAHRAWAVGAVAALAGLVALARSPAAIAAGTAMVIPQPERVTEGEGRFVLSGRVSLRVPPHDPGAARAARYFAALVSRSRGLTLAVAPDGHSPPAITFERTAGMGPEAYRLEVTSGGVRIAATTETGLFYAAVTLWQLLPAARGDGEVAAQLIQDEPAYPWRGLMLDSARHFQRPAFVKAMLDCMAWHKLNVLHWHLTDDQGWRLEIRKYPRLASVGGWRSPASVGAAAPERYGGYYTQREVRDIVAYAASRHITVVPEIDLPGHAQAAIAAYPALGSVDGPPPAVSASWGVHSYLFNPDAATLAFLEDVLAEVVELFPGPYVHIGGDEALKDQWRASARVRARSHELGRDDPEALQAYFTERMGRFLAARGRRLVGWDEILRPGLAPDAVVMSWHGAAGAHEAAVAGHDAVLTPWPTLYFDNRQSTLPSEPPGRTRVVSLEDVYRFDPFDPALSPDQQRRILGVQGNLWTEHVRTEERAEWMTWPRAAAVAELGWTPRARRSWPGFLERLAMLMPRYRALGIHAADSAFAVDARLRPNPAGVEITLSNQARFGQIRYTTDGRTPGPASALYAAPLAIAPGTEVRAATFFGAERLGGEWARRIDPRALARRNSRELGLCTDGVGLLLEPGPAGTVREPVAIDIMNPCWIYRGAELGSGGTLTAAVVPLPFNFELAADLPKVRVGDARGPAAELEVRLDGCDAEPIARLSLPAGAEAATLRSAPLPAIGGRHDLCLRIARPALEPLWAIDWVEIGE